MMEKLMIWLNNKPPPSSMGSSHSATKSSFFQCNHICLLWAGPSWVYCHASRRCLQRGKVMGTRYPDQVGGHKPCVPVVVVVRMLVPVWDRLCFATTVA